jgi:hypothetical protein
MRTMMFQSTTNFLPGSRWFLGSLEFLSDKLENLSLQEPELSEVVGSGTGRLPLAPVRVEVVLRHFHRCRYRSSTAVVLLLEGLRSHEVLAMREYGGHEDLRGSARWSVIPYVHGRMELYCCVLVLD